MKGPATEKLGKLLGQATLDDHEEILEAAEAALKSSTDDVETRHIKVVALLKLDRYAEALQQLEAGGQTLQERARLERAYAHYKLGNWIEAKAIAHSDIGGRGLKHVGAQAAYRLEEFPLVANLYNSLAGQQAEVENEDTDLKINASATDAQLSWSGGGHLVRKPKLTREDLEAYETAFNAACSSIARGELGQAYVLLKRAKDLCDNLENWSEEDKRTESLPILAQQIYTALRLEKQDDAMTISNQLPIESISDLTTRRIAQNNSLLLSSNATNPYLMHRIVHSNLTTSKNDRPFTFQARLLEHDAYVLDLASLKNSGVANSTSAKLSRQSLPSLSPWVNGIAVINAAATAQNETGKPGLKATVPLLGKRPSDVGLLLTVIQLYIAEGDHSAAGNLMLAFMKRLKESKPAADQDIRFAPGLVGLLITLLRLQNRKKEVRNQLRLAASHWLEAKKAPLLLRVAGAELAKSVKTKDILLASKIFGSLREENPDDDGVAAGVVATASNVQSKKFSSVVQRFTPISRLTAGIDAAALQEAGIPRMARPSSARARSSKKRSGEDLPKPTKKRPRKSRLPKNYDPAKTPDPERWLPLRDRSSYRPKGKRGKAKAATLTQGGVTATEGEGKTSRSTAVGPVSRGDKTSAGKSKSNKSKGGR